MGCSGSSQKELDSSPRKQIVKNGKEDDEKELKKSSDKQKTYKEEKKKKKLHKEKTKKENSYDSSSDSSDDSQDDKKKKKNVPMNIKKEEVIIEKKPELVIEVKPQPVIEQTPELVIEVKPQTVIEIKPEVIIEKKHEPVIEVKPEPVTEVKPESTINLEETPQIKNEIPKDETLDLLRIAFFGDKQCGKTQIISRLLFGKFDTHYNETTEAVEHRVKLKSGNKQDLINSLLIDNPGNQTPDYDFKSQIELAHIVVVVYDITDASDFSHACGFIKKNRNQSQQDKLWVLLGNKLDLKDFRKTTGEDLDEFAKENNLILFDEVSCEFREVEKAKKKGQIKSFFKARVYPEAQKIWKLY